MSCSRDSDCQIYGDGWKCVETFGINSCADRATADAIDDSEDALATGIIILIVIGVLIVIGIIACIVCCICGAAWCCKKAMKEDKEGGQKEAKLEMADVAPEEV